MTRLTENIVSFAQSQVGVREAEENNTGPEILEYMRATWMPEESNLKGYPWCAAFVCWVVKKAAIQSGFDDFERYLGADAYGWEKWAAKKGYQVLDESMPAEPGDLVTFDFSHIGIITKDNGEYISTIEGNTNGKGDRDSESGDGVWEKSRRRELVKSFIRLS